MRPAESDGRAWHSSSRTGRPAHSSGNRRVPPRPTARRSSAPLLRRTRVRTAGPAGWQTAVNHPACACIAGHGTEGRRAQLDETGTPATQVSCARVMHSTRLLRLAKRNGGRTGLQFRSDRANSQPCDCVRRCYSQPGRQYGEYSRRPPYGHDPVQYGYRTGTASKPFANSAPACSSCCSQARYRPATNTLLLSCIIRCVLPAIS